MPRTLPMLHTTAALWCHRTGCTHLRMSRLCISKRRPFCSTE